MTKAEYAKAHTTARSKTARLVIDGKRKIRREYLHIAAVIAKVVRENRFKPFLEEQICAAFPRAALHKFIIDTIVGGRVTVARNVAEIDKQYLFDALDKVPGHGLSKEKIAAMFEAKADRMRITNSRPYRDLVKNAGEKKYTGTGFAYEAGSGYKDVRFDYTFRKSHSLSKSVWDTVNHTEEDILNVVHGSIAQGRDVKTVAADLMSYVKGGPQVIPGRWGKLLPGTREYVQRFGKAGIDYRAMRLYRSEMYRNLQESAVSDGESNPACTGEYDWMLMPGREEWNCDCPEVAAAGPYRADTIPEYRHPNCDCTVRPRLKAGEKFLDELRAYVNGEPGGDGIAQWAQGNGLEEDEAHFMKTPPGENEYPFRKTDTTKEDREKIVKAMSERGIAVDFDESDKLAIDYIPELFDNIKKDFPRIGEVIKEMRYSEFLNVNEGGLYKAGANEIAYNKNIFSHVDNLIRYMTKDQGWFSTTDKRGAISHEFGHAIEYLIMSASKNDLIVQSTIRNLLIKNNIKTWGDVSRSISQYSKIGGQISKTNKYRELIAEAVSEYLAVKTPREITKKIYHELKLLYKEYVL